MNLSGKKINFLGDSITHGSGTSGEDKRFSNLIAAKTGAICRNYGIGGTRIARQFNRTIPDFDDNDYCSKSMQDGSGRGHCRRFRRHERFRSW